MVYKIIIEDKKIELPNNLELQERIELCEKLISENLIYFTYELPTQKSNSFASSASEKVKIRLMIMGEYIYSASMSGINDTVITQWRKRRNTINETVFSELERASDE